MPLRFVEGKRRRRAAAREMSFPQRRPPGPAASEARSANRIKEGLTGRVLSQTFRPLNQSAVMGGEAWKYYTSANRGRDRKAPVWISCADPDA